MKDSQILESFFEEQHRRWRKRAYTFIHSIRERAPHPSDYGEWLRRKNTQEPVHHQAAKKAAR